MGFPYKQPLNEHADYIAGYEDAAKNIPFDMTKPREWRFGWRDYWNSCIIPTPLDPLRPCEECGEPAEETVAEHGVAHNYCSVCYQSWCESLEPGDEHYHPRN